MIEFALALTLLVSIIFGILEGAIVIFRYNAVAHLAQEGARWAAVRGNTASGAMQATTAQLVTYVRSRSLGGPTLTVTANSDPRLLSPGDTLQVAVSQQVAPISGFAPFGTITLSSTAQMVMQR